MADLGINTILLTDELIKQYSGDRVIYNKGNLNLKRDKIIEPVRGGLYDASYFGSVLKDTCNCRTIKKENVYCHNCGSTPFDERTRNSRFARIELPFAYVPYFKTGGLLKVLRDTFRINLDFTDLQEEVAGRNNLLKALELGQVDIQISEDSTKKSVLRLHDQFTDIKKCSYEGLLAEMKSNGFSAEATKCKSFIDNYVLVTPASMRGIGFSTINGVRQISLPYTTSVFTAILYAIEQLREKGAKNNIKEEVIVRAVFRNFCRKALVELSEFNKSSKENLARQMYAARVPFSSRGVITAGPNLRTDEVSMPEHNVYAMLKKEFIDHLMTSQNLPFYKANKLYNDADEATWNEFQDWVKNVRKPVTILTRQPSLHRYSMLAFRIKMHKGHDIKLPLEICAPFGGDFDGDTMSSVIVNPEHQDEIFKTMSPTALKFYDKNQRPILSPSHGVNKIAH